VDVVVLSSEAAGMVADSAWAEEIEAAADEALDEMEDAEEELS